LLGTTAPLYSGLSLLWESPSINTDISGLAALLIKAGALDLVSHHSTIGEFLESRRVIYEYDSPRYPMYFSKSSNSGLAALGPTHFKGTSTTAALSKSLLSWDTLSADDAGDDVEAVRLAQECARSSLLGRREEAITFSLFLKQLSSMRRPEEIGGVLRRRVSALYTKEYMDFAGGDLPTGVSGLDYFDRLSRLFPVYDIPLLSTLLMSCGLERFLDEPWQPHEDIWGTTSQWRGAGWHAEFRHTVRILLRALEKVESRVRPGTLPESIYARRQKVKAMLTTVVSGVPVRSVLEWSYSLEQLSAILKVFGRRRDVASAIEEEKSRECELGADVLIVVATDVERDTFIEEFARETGNSFSRRFGQRKTYYDLGVLGGAHTVLVQTEMGSGSPGASFSTVADACDELFASSVVLVGIAFGVDPDTQSIGDVLVSRQLRPYELQRVGTTPRGGEKILIRADKATASTRLIDRLRSSAVGWTDATVRFGVVLSGEKLIDNVDFRDDIVSLEPEAIGGEMEGAGAYAAAHDRNKEWIVVKAVCDWADGKKRHQKAKRQKLAATNAARLVIRAITLGGFAG
jgi:nucleoside phosphorylase